MNDSTLKKLGFIAGCALVGGVIGGVYGGPGGAAAGIAVGFLLGLLFMPLIGLYSSEQDSNSLEGA